ncbi:MAG: hypothetical protein RL594_474 [Bacteroidota bacterium]
MASVSEHLHSAEEPDPNANVVMQAKQVVMHTQQWTGPLPPPSVLHQYDEVFPGLAERIVTSMELEQQHRHALDRKLFETHRDAFSRGQWIAATIALVCLVLGFVLGYNGHSAAAVAFATGGLGQVVLAFLGSRDTRSKDAE